MKRIFAFILLLIFSVSFSSCSHEHKYSEDWSYNETHHWHEASCGHDLISEKEEHLISSGACEKCAYSSDEEKSIDTNSNENTEISTEGKDVKEGVCSLDIICVSGTPNAYTLQDNVLTFTAIDENSVYSISGELDGEIVISIDEAYELELQLCGLNIASSDSNPITILSGDKASIVAKNGYENTIYDKREEVIDEELYKGAIYSLIDLDVKGKGSLSIVSNNNGIHTKDDLQVKNLTLSVVCQDNALKGNDSVEIIDANVTLIAKAGDGIKTTSSDISSKGNQRGNITISNSTVTIYSACDGIDASHDVTIDGEGELNIYTDKYSTYSESVNVSNDKERYIRFTSNAYKYSIKYYNSESDYEWVNATYYKSVQGGPMTYYYYSFPVMEEYTRLKLFVYSSEQEYAQEEEVTLSMSDYHEWNTAYDTLAINYSYNGVTLSWTNYSSTISMGGFGGMQEGNSDKGEYSTKGIKASNQITINSGIVNIKAYDDAIHANNAQTLENGSTPLGNVTINGGKITLYSNDDGIHADGATQITSGDISIINSYEGIEGNTVLIGGGNISVISSDDGINATATSGETISVSGGRLYIYAKGDGVDSNSTSSGIGIVFSGGNTTVICNSNGNSAIDTERGYTHTGGYVLALTTSGGMSSESKNVTTSGKMTSTTLSLSQGKYLQVREDDETIYTLKMPCVMSAQVIFLGEKSVSAISTSSGTGMLDENGVYWKK